MLVSLVAGQDDAGRRLDRILRKSAPDMPVSAIYRLVRKGAITVNGKASVAAARIHAGDRIEFVARNMPGGKPDRNINNACSGAALAASQILFENNDLLIVNKAAGMVTHGRNSLDTAVNAYLTGKLPPSLSFVPGPLHRLDRETSGVIVFSKTLAGAVYFSEALRSGCLHKTYIALVCGVLKDNVCWYDYMVRNKAEKKSYIKDAAFHGAKQAFTQVSPLFFHERRTLVNVKITTGRSHQIRAAAAAHGFPLYGDFKYGGGSGAFFLHAFALEFPPDNPLGLPAKIIAPLPPFNSF